jgi:hypothetical protein
VLEIPTFALILDDIDMTADEYPDEGVIGNA